MMDAERLSHALAGVFPGRILSYPVIGSTREVASRLVRRGEWDDTLVLADYQTEGRGTRGRIWHAPPGECLLASLLLRPRTGVQPVDSARPLADAVMAGVRAATAVETRWKEPNDVLLDGRKLAGILVESTYRGREVESWVLSLGLNVNVTEFPRDIRDRAVSLSEFVDPVPEREDLLAAILREFRYVLDAPKR
jgi:BirA family biotin operon repressor/biotin-[acetyl-CoA-carboxylase] ligase